MIAFIASSILRSKGKKHIPAIKNGDIRLICYWFNRNKFLYEITMFNHDLCSEKMKFDKEPTVQGKLNIEKIVKDVFKDQDLRYEIAEIVVNKALNNEVKIRVWI